MNQRLEHHQNQCRTSRHTLHDVLENGNELVGNVLVAAEHLQVQHRTAIEKRNDALREVYVAFPE